MGFSILIARVAFWEMVFAVGAWIKITGEQEAQGELQAVYKSVKNARGSVSNVMRVQSLDPESIRLHLDLYLHLMFGKSTLTRLEREMIAVAVSQSNQCSYCVTHHSEALSVHTKDPRILETVRERGENLSPRNKAMLDYAVKLTRILQQYRKKTWTRSELQESRMKRFSELT